MRIIDVINTNKTGMRLVVDNEAEATEIALSFGHIKKATNGTIEDLTESLLSYEKNYKRITSILQGGKKGLLFYQGISFSLAEIMSPNYKKIKEKKEKAQAGFGIVEYKKIDGKWKVIKNED